MVLDWEAIGLANGVEALALIKASSVLLMTDSESMKFSPRNQLSGTVRTVETGAVNYEVAIDLPSGGTIASVITNANAKGLQLAPRQVSDRVVQGIQRAAGAKDVTASLEKFDGNSR